MSNFANWFRQKVDGAVERMVEKLWKPYQRRRQQFKLDQIRGLRSKAIHLNGAVKIQKPDGLILGKNVHIGDNTHLDCRGGVVIADNVHISRNVTVYSTNHDYLYSRVPYSHKLMGKPVVIHRNVWIGMNVNITPGVTIGEGSIVGLGSTVTTDVLPFHIVGGNPAKVIRRLDSANCEQRESEYGVGGVSGREMTIAQQGSYKNLLDIDSSNICFVLSTGRSGSNSIINTLRQVPDVFAEHEPNFNLIRLCAEYLANFKDEGKVLEELRNYYTRCSFFPAKSTHYIESDQKLAPFVPMLQIIFPEAKFIWIFREPKGFIKSSAARKWFEYDASQNVTTTGVLIDPDQRSYGLRLGGDTLEGLSSRDWNAFNLFERNAWYWTYWNRLIETNLETVPKKNKFVIQLKELNTYLPSLLDFLNIKDSNNTKMLRTNTMKAKDKKNVIEKPDQIDELVDKAHQRFSATYFADLGKYERFNNSTFN